MVGEGSSVEDWGGYMLDTTEFNAVAKAELPLSSLAGRRLFATHVQLDELENTPGEELRARLRAAFEEIAAENLTRQVLFGMSVSGTKRVMPRRMASFKRCSLASRSWMGRSCTQNSFATSSLRKPPSRTASC
jgi:hypothetical protein